MYQFVESIKFINNIHYNLEFHQQRFNFTRSVYFPQGKKISLSEILKLPSDLLMNQLYKCRIIYAEDITEVVYEPYERKTINQFHLAVCPYDFNYEHKSVQRKFFDDAKMHLKSNEDFIYVRKGLVTDTSYANIVFSDGKNYYTPSNPLLKGTKRALYLKNNIIKEEEIRVSDIQRFETLSIINAMIDLDESPTYSCYNLLLSHIHLKL